MKEAFEVCLAVSIAIVLIVFIFITAIGLERGRQNGILKREIERLKFRHLPRVDKNGKQVQEGDIIRYSFYSEGELVNDDFVIEWKDEDFYLGWRCKPLNNSESLFDMFPQEDFSKYIAVIGNINDNPIRSEVSE